MSVNKYSEEYIQAEFDDLLEQLGWGGPLYGWDGYTGVDAVETKPEKAKEIVEAKIEVARSEPVQEAREARPRVATTNGANDFPVALPDNPERNAVFDFPPVDQVDVQTYTCTTPVITRATAPYARATTFSDTLLKTAHTNIRRGGSEASNAASTIGPDAVNNPEASIHPFMVQAAAAFLNVESGYVANATHVGMNAAVVEIANTTAFFEANPSYRPIYLPNAMGAPAFGAFVALLRVGGIGAYGWTRGDHNHVVPINTLRSYPTGYGADVAIVVEDGSTFARNPVVIDHAALTRGALMALLQWYKVWCRAGALMPLVWKTVAALSYGYGPMEYGADDGAGQGLRYARVMKTCVVTDEDGNGPPVQVTLHGGTARVPPAAELPIVGVNTHRTVIPHLTEADHSRVLNCVFEAFRRDDIEGFGMVQHEAAGEDPAETDDEFRARQLRAQLNRQRTTMYPGGVRLSYISDGTELVQDIEWAALWAVDWDHVEGIGVPDRQAVRAYRWVIDPPVPGLDNREVKRVNAPLYNVYGQAFTSAVYYPEPALDGVLAVFAGIATLAPGGEKAGGGGTQRVRGDSYLMEGARLVDCLHRYAVKLHWLAQVGWYVARLDYQSMIRNAVSGPALMSMLAGRYKNWMLPADATQEAWPDGQIMNRESSAHVRSLRDTAFVGYRHPGAWVVERDSVSMGRAVTMDALAAIDAMVRTTYQSGLTLSVVSRGAQINVMRTLGPNGRMIYHALSVPLTAVDANQAYGSPVVIAPGTGVAVLDGQVSGGRSVVFTNN